MLFPIPPRHWHDFEPRNTSNLLRVPSGTQYGICLVFACASGRITVSPSRAAVLGNRNVGGAVKRDRPGFRVFLFSVVVLLLACLVTSRVAIPAAQQSQSESQSQSQSPADDPKQNENKPKDDVKRNTPGEKLRPGHSLRMDVDLALVNVTVTDPYNRLVTGLEMENFRVFEDNSEQEVVTFSAEDVPISIGVIFDFSGSMANKVGKAREAAVQFFKTANPQDEFFLVSFNERAELTSAFTNSVEDLQSSLMLTSAKGRTCCSTQSTSG